MEDLAPDEGDLDAWAAELRDDILKQVHQALDMYEDAAQERIASVLSQDNGQRIHNSRLATDTAHRTEALENRVAALEAPAAGASSGRGQDAAFDARLSAFEARHGPVEARLAALEARLAGMKAVDERTASRADSELSLSQQQPLDELVTSSALAATKAKIAKGLLALEEGVLNLQGELAMLQARMQMQGVSGTIFSLRAVDMDERSRAKVLEVVVSKEAEVKRQLDGMQDAKDRGNVAELLTEFRVRVANAPASGDPSNTLQIVNFSRDSNAVGGEIKSARSDIRSYSVSGRPGGRSSASESLHQNAAGVEVRSGRSEAEGPRGSSNRTESVGQI